MHHAHVVRLVARASVVAACATAFACSSSDDGDGAGAVAFTTWGEGYIEDEIPAEDVEDGFTVRFDKFLIALGEVTVAESEGAAPVASMPESKIFDMHQKGVKPVVTFPGLPGKAFPAVSFRVAPATSASLPAEGATEADKQALVAGGYSVLASGSISKDGASKRFAWGFTTDTVYGRCEAEIGGKLTPGVVVTNGGTDTAEITIHADHLFYDDLQDPEAKLRLQSIFDADADADGTITMEELAAVKLVDIPRERGAYGTGNVSGVNDLGAFVAALSRTLGHFRGEGECFATAR